jgi:PAS domain S-box-containing protein
MKPRTKTVDQLEAEIEELRQQLAESREALEAIRRGEVDAVVVDRPGGPQIYTLTGADTPYRVMVEEMQEGAVTLSDDGIIVYCNKQIARLLDASHQDLLGRPFRNFLAPESVSLFESLSQRSRTESSRGEVRLLAANGMHVPAYLALRLLPADGLAQTSVVIADLTEQKQYQEIVASEVFATSVLDQAQDAIVVCDPSGQVIRANRAAERLSAINTMLQPFDLAFPLRREGSDAELSLLPLASTSQFLRSIEASLVRPDGRRTHLLLSVGQMLDFERKVLGIVITMTDITERKHAEETLRESAAELARSNRELDQFASVVSHDLQEPLRTVRGFADLLQKKYAKQLDAEAGTFIKYAVDGATRMERLIKALLAYARVGTRRREPVPINAGEVLRQALDDLHQSIQDAVAEITHSELPTVRADPSQLAQLFQNLLGNALKFRSESPPKIHVDAHRDGDCWQFSLRDNGIGIDPKYHDQVFDVFRRLNRREEYEGTGIGLAICKKIVDRHGGRIWVESQPGQGATFHITLPT